MSLPKTEQTPDDPQKMPPARRRRARRLLLPLSATEREAFIAATAHRASPSFDFSLLSMLAGGVLAVGVLLDSPALLVLGALLAPLMSPMIGLALGTVTGSVRYFVRSLTAMAIASGLVFGIGVLTGIAAQMWLPRDFLQGLIHARLSWDGLIVLALGAVLTTAWLVHNGRSAAVASVALSYEIYIPVVTAGFGLGSGVTYLWPDGVVVFAIHLACAALLGAITLGILGFRPLTLFGYTMGGMVMLVAAILVIGLGGAGAAFGGQIAIPTPLPSATPTATQTLTPSLTPSSTATPAPPTVTPSPSATATITPSPTFTLTPSPTPVYALVNSVEGGGGIMRAEPRFSADYITSVLNGTLVVILSETPVADEDGHPWQHVRLPDGREGWMLQSVLAVATPAPGW